ncbi:hypothetical protein HHI36_005564 [Cryptolaemus montrouzieri]|uniref:Uncharacterized protein n=1 Tax=Cryptolaemus montrouzieri TaxID=559131 RepID=A0ABD2NUJ5_9CUCU
MNSNNSYIPGFKLNYSSDTDNSSNSLKSSNTSLFTSIQQIDTSNSKDFVNGKQKEDSKEENSFEPGYFSRLKFNTSSFLRRRKNLGNIFPEKKVINQVDDEIISTNIPIQRGGRDENNQQSHRLRSANGNFLSFLKVKREDNKKYNQTYKNDYNFLDEMCVADRCRISIECKNNAISIEGHKKI